MITLIVPLLNVTLVPALERMLLVPAIICMKHNNSTTSCSISKQNKRSSNEFEPWRFLLLPFSAHLRAEDYKEEQTEHIEQVKSEKPWHTRIPIKYVSQGPLCGKTRRPPTAASNHRHARDLSAAACLSSRPVPILPAPEKSVAYHGRQHDKARKLTAQLHCSQSCSVGFFENKL
jgi:hypothetical protein